MYRKKLYETNKTFKEVGVTKEQRIILVGFEEKELDYKYFNVEGERIKIEFQAGKTTIGEVKE